MDRTSGLAARGKSGSNTLNEFDAVYAPPDAKDVTVHLESEMVADIDDELEWLNRQMRIGDFRSAKTFFDSHLKAHSHHPSVCVQYAEMFLRMKDYNSVRQLDERTRSDRVNWESESLTVANWTLIQAVAMSYTQFEVPPIHKRLGSRSGVILPISEKDRMSSTGIRILCLSMELYKRTAILTHSVPASTRGRKKMSDWANWRRLYRHLLTQGRVWDMHDVFASATAVYSIDQVFVELLGYYETDPLDRLINDWKTTETDESTQLALLDILSIAVLHTNMLAADFRFVSHCLDLASPIAESLMTYFPGSTRSRPFLHWLLAKATFSARREKMEGRAPVVIAHMMEKDFPGIFSRPSSLGSSCIFVPFYVPVDQENPGLKALDTASQNNEPLEMVLRASNELQDYHIQQLCLKELIVRSQDPSSFFAQLSSIQKATQNMDGHFNTCLSRYLICNDKKDKRELAADLVGLGWWEKPFNLVKPSMVAARDIIQVALLDHGVNSAPRSIAAGLRYYRLLSNTFRGLIDEYYDVPSQTMPWDEPPPSNPSSARETGDVPLGSTDLRGEAVSASGYSSSYGGEGDTEYTISRRDSVFPRPASVGAGPTSTGVAMFTGISNAIMPNPPREQRPWEDTSRALIPLRGQRNITGEERKVTRFVDTVDGGSSNALILSPASSGQSELLSSKQPEPFVNEQPEPLDGSYTVNELEPSSPGVKPLSRAPTMEEVPDHSNNLA
ncbi:hypothetical protein B0T25DRAFT_363831 [Lasiosphaeria hispida]|uniref:Uncharacterized protein n=1 Tax=Lasiosphaeria hispida TaxID=260671 RepID=A0AAJ0M7U0_9PEZI|nr:hypothetical protein B0T25DRAFT_363831 [Lasiosphaeria hispida]